MTEFKKGDKVLVKPGEVSRYGWAPKDYTTPLTVSYEQHDGYVAVLAGVLEYLFRPEQLTPAPDPSKFKKGDRVQKVAPHNAVRDGENDPNGPDDFAREAAMGALGTVTGTAATHLYIEWDNGKTSCVPREVVAPAPEDHGTGDGSASDICAEPGCNCDLERRFPAPLDPSKVKAGDTVTVTVTDDKHGSIVVTGEAWEDYPGDLAVGPHLLSRDNVTLTAHTPAPEPEPEPEWKPGTVAVVETEGAYPGGPRRAVRRGGVWHSLDMEGYAIDANVTCVRPLFVIDPAHVDVESVGAALYEAMKGIEPGVFSWEEVARTALAEVGIEVPR
jgi:hypothetical protein